MKRILNRAGNMILECATARRFYRGWGDYARANFLRLTENRFTRPILPRSGDPTALHLRGYDHPIFVRRGNSDFLVLREIFEHGEYEAILKMGLPPDANILDLGANIGFAAVYLNHHFPQCRITSVEPDAENCKMIRANCAGLLDSGRLQLFQGFVAAKDGAASIKRDGDHGLSWSFQKGEPRGDELIDCYSIPSLCRQSAMDRIDLLKCDVEGTEVELFADCSDWIGKVRNLFVETHGEFDPARLQDSLRAAGWKFRAMRETATIAFLSAVNAPNPVAI